jgi:hypothetical protein
MPKHHYNVYVWAGISRRGTASILIFDGVHYAYTNILITIEDVNDETPIFTIKNVEKTYTEGLATPINTGKNNTVRRGDLGL